MLLETVLASLIPVGIEGIKQYINKKTGTPLSVDDQVKLQQSETERLKALAELDNPHGTPSQWVVDLRASSRYIGALIVILAGLSTLYVKVDPAVALIAMEAVGIVFGFLFGQRVLVNQFKGK